jgi:hypothetical protein
MKLRILSALLCAAALCGLASAGPNPLAPKRIAVCGPNGHADEDVIRVKPYSLVKFSVSNVPEKAALRWKVTPSAGVSKATTSEDRLEFAAPPGTYTVELLVLIITDGKPVFEEHSATVEIEKPCDKLPPAPSPEPKPEPKPSAGKLDAVNALGRIQFGSAGCTATIIGPRRPDGRWDVLTAAHCVKHVGDRGTMKLKDGRTIGITTAVVNTTADCCWCVTDAADLENVSYAVIAEKNPAVGVKIWHMGYGIDKPGNREDGEVTSGQNADGQIRMFLSVSSGDSGGGIFRVDTNEVISCVCCTSARGSAANVWGCSAEVARRLRPAARAAAPDAAPPAAEDEWTPVQIPQRAE